MKERTVNWLLVGNVRYALSRDNGLAQSNFEMVVFEAIDYIKDKEYKKYTIEKIIQEIETDLSFYERKDKNKWLKCIEKIKSI